MMDKEKLIIKAKNKGREARLVERVKSLYPNMKMIKEKEFVQLSDKIKNATNKEEIHNIINDFQLYNKISTFIKYFAKLYAKTDLSEQDFDDALSSYLLGIMEVLNNTVKYISWYKNFQSFTSALNSKAKTEIDALVKKHTILNTINENNGIECTFSDKPNLIQEQINIEFPLQLEHLGKNLPNNSIELFDGNRSKELEDALNKGISTLNKELQECVILYFGLNGEQPKTLKEIAEIKKLTSETIRLRLSKALRMLRHPFRSHHYREFYF